MFVTNIAFIVHTECESIHLIIVALSKASCSPCTCWLVIYRRIRVLQLNRGLNGTMSTTLVIGATSNWTPLLFTGSLSQAQSSLLYHLISQPFSATVRHCTDTYSVLRMFLLKRAGGHGWIHRTSPFPGTSNKCRRMVQSYSSICCVKGTVN